ncbi:hypothetical protein SBDP1_190013 [Syntrophobacter sp. SbD1]|nr:hypothetical protein SBDP1_190013 [Syntrophobacter sp. SbD1]
MARYSNFPLEWFIGLLGICYVQWQRLSKNLKTGSIRHVNTLFYYMYVLQNGNIWAFSTVSQAVRSSVWAVQTGITEVCYTTLVSLIRMFSQPYDGEVRGNNVR